MDEQPPSSLSEPTDPDGSSAQRPEVSDGGSHPAPTPVPPTDASLLHVDPGALALASLAAAAALIVSDRDWDILSMVVGVSLLVIVLAHHRPWAGPLTVRGALLRFTFAGTTALAFCIAIAWPVRLLMPYGGWWFAELRISHVNAESAPRDAEWVALTTELLAWLWVLLVAGLYRVEPRLSQLLERPFPSRRETSRVKH